MTNMKSLINGFLLIHFVAIIGVFLSFVFFPKKNPKQITKKKVENFTSKKIFGR